MADSQLHNTLGALLDGAIVANLLFGIFVIQVHFYYRRFPQDQRSLKILVRLANMHIFLCWIVWSSRLLLYGMQLSVYLFSC